MPLPSWVYNQSSLPPWMQTPAPPPNPQRAPPPQVGGGNIVLPPGPSPGRANTGGYRNNPPRPGRDIFGNPIPTPSTMQGGGGSQVSSPTAPIMRAPTSPGYNTNTGMVGLLPPGHPGSNVLAPEPQFVEPQLEDDSSIYAGLGGPNPLNGQYASLMQQMQQLLNKPQQQYTPFVPKEQQYTQSPELTNAIAMIRQLAESGGYSEQDKSELRARGVSPIRSVYANAQQGLDRSKALQGGYSPGHTAATSKLARELSDRIAGQTTNVNADIADKVAQGKMAMAPQLGNITSHVNDLINQIAGSNTASGNEAGMFNTKMNFDTNQANTQNTNQLMGMIQQLFGTGADMQGRDADRNVDIAGLRQRGIESRNQNRTTTAASRNQFNQGNRELSQNMQQFMSRLGFDSQQANNQNSMQGRELDQNMQQFLARMGLDTGNAANSNAFDWAQLEQQGGLGLIQALMQMMGQRGRA